MAQSAKKLSETEALYQEYLSFRKNKRYTIFQILKKFREYWFRLRHASSDKSQGEQWETMIKNLSEPNFWQKNKKFFIRIAALSNEKEDELYYKIKENALDIKAERMLKEIMYR